MPSQVATKSQFSVFNDSLEELALVISQHGTASVEADLARAKVRVARDEAVKAWREGEAA